MKIIFVFGFLLFLLQSNLGLNVDEVEEVYKWKRVEYENLPKPEFSQIGPYTYYIPENNNIVGFGYHPASKLMIVTIPRIRPGVPTSLGAFCVRDYTPGSNLKIWGFPNYKINELHDVDFQRGTQEERGRALWNKPENRSQAENYYYSNFHEKYPYLKQIPFYDKQFPIKVGPYYDLDRIISVFHITIDERCNRLFIVDNGKVTYYKNSTYAIQKPALVVMDLPTNGCETRVFPITRRLDLPDHIIAKGSYSFIQIVPDFQTETSCDDLYLYIPNSLFNYLMVYDYKNNDFWTMDHQTFQPVVSESYFVFDETMEFQKNMGIYSISLGYPDQYGDRTAYYTSIAGTAQYAVSTKVLKDKRNSPISYSLDDFRIFGYRPCNHQSHKTLIDYTSGVMFYSEVQTKQISCWNIKKPLNPDNIGVVYESENFHSGKMFIDSQGYLWFHSRKTPLNLPLDLSTVSNRIFRVRVSDAIRGTVCENYDTI